MGVINFPDNGETQSVRRRSDGGDIRETSDNGYGDAVTEVPGPGAARKSRSRKRLSPAAVIAGSLAPDATHLNPAEIIARSFESAFAGFAHAGAPLEAPLPQTPPPPRPAPQPAPLQAPAQKPTRQEHTFTGDPFAHFWDVWIEHHDYLFKQSMRFMSGNMADAEDALSQAMLKGSQHFDAATIRNERAWLTRLVHNACMDQHRSRKRQYRLSEEINGDDPEDAPNITPQPTRTCARSSTSWKANCCNCR
ncbi:RNA polymerase sigma factor [Pseudomonadota bacterium]